MFANDALLTSPGNSVIAPAGLIFANRLRLNSRNHRFPSGPVAMPVAPEFALGMENSLNVPAVPFAGVVYRPILLTFGSVYARCRVRARSPRDCY